MKKILVTGAFGQIGSDLVPALQQRYGKKSVVAVGHKNIPPDFDGILETYNAFDKGKLEKFINKYRPEEVYHLAALLSSDDPDETWDINVNGLRLILHLAQKYKFRVFWPSSAAVFGPNSPMVNTPQHTITEPETMYGITKVAGELLCQFYFKNFGVDVRSVRYPRVISLKNNPTKSGTDYLVNIFYAALRGENFVIPVKPTTRAPVMYIDDTLSAVYKIMDADSSKLTTRTSYNLGVISCTAETLVRAIRKFIPNFRVKYKPEEERINKLKDRPLSIDDSQAKTDWGWKQEYDLEKLVKAMVNELKVRLNKEPKGV